MPRGRPRQAPLPPLNNRIRETREERGWSIAKLGKMCRPHIPPQTIQRHETGQAQVDLLQLEIYAVALGVPPEELLASGLRIDPQARSLLDLFQRLPTAERAQLVKIAEALIPQERQRAAG